MRSAINLSSKRSWSMIHTLRLDNQVSSGRALSPFSHIEQKRKIGKHGFYFHAPERIFMLKNWTITSSLQFHIDPLLLFPITKARRFPRGTVIPDWIQLSARSSRRNTKSKIDSTTQLCTIYISRHYHRAYITLLLPLFYTLLYHLLLY